MSGNGGQVPRMLLLSDPSDGSKSSMPAAGSVLDRIKQFLPQIASANAQLETMEDGDVPSMDCGITVEKLTAQDSDDSDDDSSSGDEEAASQDESDEEQQVHQNDEAESREKPASSTIAFDICVFNQDQTATESGSDVEEGEHDEDTGGVPKAFREAVTAERSAANDRPKKKAQRKRKLIEEVE